MSAASGKKEQTHERIVAQAATALRGAGVNGIGVADLMKAAGLTHGGFYAHFESKEALVAEALVLAADQTLALLKKASDKTPDARGSAIDAYLSPRHCEHPEKGCSIAALGADIARLSPATRRAFELKLEELFTLFAGWSGEGAQARSDAIATVSALVGALVMARAVRSRELAAEILAATRANLHRH